jgi:hypothetical protein
MVSVVKELSKQFPDEFVLFHDPEHDEALLKEGYAPYPDKEHHYLGYGARRDRGCGARVPYGISC